MSSGPSDRAENDFVRSSWKSSSERKFIRKRSLLTIEALNRISVISHRMTFGKHANDFVKNILDISIDFSHIK